MTALTTFDINYFHMSHRPVCLTDCLTACPPSLKNLSLECRDLVVSPFKTKLESIETLKIDVPKITNDLTDVISTCFPNLVELSLRGRITENVNLTLDIPRFQKVAFSTRPLAVYEKCIHGFTFKSPALTKPHNYIRNRNKEFGTPRANMRINRKVIKDLPLLSVEFLTEAKPEFKGFDIVVVPC